MKILRTIAAALVTGIPAITMAATWLPAEGIWQIDGANGSGLALDVRDNAIGVGLYTYDDAGNGIWYSGAGVLADGALALDLTRFERGEGDAVTAVDTLSVTLQLVASAAGTLSIDGGEPTAVRHATFGTGYMEGLELQSAAGTVHVVPDMRDRWVFSPTDAGGLGSVEITFAQIQRSDGAIAFTTGETEDATLEEGDFSFVCATTPSPVGPGAGCLLYAHAGPLPQLVPPTEIARFDPADLSAMRVAGAPDTMIGFRVPYLYDAPQSGIWQIVGRFGEGVTLDLRQDQVAIGIYGYDDDGNAAWSLATGAIAGDTVEADLTTFAGGSCLTCEHMNPTVDSIRPLRLEFVGTTRARLTIGDDEPLALTLLPFGADYLAKPFADDPDSAEFGTHALPALNGGWAQTDVYSGHIVDPPSHLSAAYAFGGVETASDDGATYNSLHATTTAHWGPPDEFGGTYTTSLTCEANDDDDPFDCVLTRAGGPGSPPAPAAVMADIHPWNISANRISGINVDGFTPRPVYLFRIPPRPVTDSAR